MLFHRSSSQLTRSTM